MFFPFRMADGRRVVLTEDGEWWRLIPDQTDGTSILECDPNGFGEPVEPDPTAWDWSQWPAWWKNRYLPKD